MERRWAELPSPLNPGSSVLEVEQGAGGNGENIVEVIVASPVQFVVTDQKPQVGPDGFKVLDDPKA